MLLFALLPIALALPAPQLGVIATQALQQAPGDVTAILDTIKNAGTSTSGCWREFKFKGFKKHCPSGFKAALGFTCWQTDCPIELPFKCGRACLSTDSCRGTIVSQLETGIQSVIGSVASMNPLGVVPTTLNTVDLLASWPKCAVPQKAPLPVTASVTAPKTVSETPIIQPQNTLAPTVAHEVASPLAPVSVQTPGTQSLPVQVGTPTQKPVQSAFTLPTTLSIPANQTQGKIPNSVNSGQKTSVSIEDSCEKY